MSKKPTKSAKTQDRLRIHANFDDVLGVTMPAQRQNNTNSSSNTNTTTIPKTNKNKKK